MVTGAVAIGFAPIFVRLSPVGPSATAFWRIILALPPLWLWMSLEREDKVKHRPPASCSDYLLLSMAGLFFAGDLSLWHWSIKLTSVANATLLVNFAPVFVTLGGWLIFKQRVRIIFILGMGLALISHMGGQSLIAYALAHLPASFSSVALLVQPVAALLAWFLLNEAVGVRQILGGVLVLFGILMAGRGSP